MAVLIGVVVLAVGLVGGTTFAVVRAIALWRTLKRTGRAFGTETARIADVTAGMQAHLDRATASNERLGDASARLARSRAQLQVQLQAIREARHTMRRLLWFVPGI